MKPDHHTEAEQDRLACAQGHGVGDEKCSGKGVHVTVREEGGQEDRQRELDRIYNRISKLVIPLFLAIATINHLDRTNLSFASLTMNADLGFNAAVYGLGSSLFFAGFVVFQVGVVRPFYRDLCLSTQRRRSPEAEGRLKDHACLVYKPCWTPYSGR